MPPVYQAYGVCRERIVMKQRQDWDFTVPRGKTLTLKEAVGQALGGASMCWSNVSGAGEFDSRRAGHIADVLERWLRTQVHLFGSQVFEIEVPSTHDASDDRSRHECTRETHEAIQKLGAWLEKRYPKEPWDENIILVGLRLLKRLRREVRIQGSIAVDRGNAADELRETMEEMVTQSEKSRDLVTGALMRIKRWLNDHDSGYDVPATIEHMHRIVTRMLDTADHIASRNLRVRDIEIERWRSEAQRLSESKEKAGDDDAPVLAAVDELSVSLGRVENIINEGRSKRWTMCTKDWKQEWGDCTLHADWIMRCVLRGADRGLFSIDGHEHLMYFDKAANLDLGPVRH